MKFLLAVDAAHVRDFRLVADEYFAATYERFPQMASRLGLKEFNARLGANGPEVHRAQLRLAEQTLTAVEKLPEAAFQGDDWLDRRTFLAMLRVEILESGELERWRNNPQTHCDGAVDAIFDLMVRHLDDLGSVLPAIESRLGKIPEFLAAGATCIRQPVPLWTKLAQASCEGAVSFFAEIQPELARHAKSPARLKRLLTNASRAFTTYANAISRKKAGPENGFSLGRERFEYLMREKLGFDWSLPEALANGHRLVAQMEYLLEREAARHGHGSARQTLEKAAREWQPDRPLLDEYIEVTQTVKQRLAELDIVTLPKGESLKVLPTPAFLRHHFPTAAYNPPPPYSSKQEGIFWVNDLSLIQTDPKKQAEEIRQHFGLELTSAHEAYPGHHLQFAVQNQHPSKLRRLANHAIYYEGWTMWCETMSVERKLVKNPYAPLLQLHDALWRAHRIVIDCGLHGGTLSFDGACKILMKGVNFTKARAAGDVNWYTSSPTVPMSYLLGRIEVEKLYRRFVGGQGWTLKQFNDWMLGHGSIPWSWIVQAHDQRA